MTEHGPRPENIPEHTLHSCIATGSYGEVWLAQNSTGTWRAVKIVRRDRFEHTRPFEREYRGIQEFEPVSRDHPGLMQLLQVGRASDDSFFYAVMELADDRSEATEITPQDYRPRTLQSELDERGAFPITECLEWGAAIAGALAFLHEQQLVHRDVKPANIIFVKGRPKLADIGLVSRLNASFGHVGTHGYIPPEGLGQPPADVYALGKVLYEMITGHDRHSFPSPPEELREPNAPPEFKALNGIVLNACECNPIRRNKANEILNHLEKIARGEMDVAPRSNRLAIVLALVALTTGIMLRPNNTANQPQPPDMPKPVSGLIVAFEFDGNTAEAGGHIVETHGEMVFAPNRQGQPDSAVFFDGNTTRLILPPSPQLAGITNITISVWLKRHKSRRDFERQDYGGIIDRIPEPGFAFLRLWEGRPDFGTNEPYHQTVQPRPLPFDEWVHLAAVYDGTHKIIYVNGQQVRVDHVGVGALHWGNAALRIGHEVSGSFHGWLDALHIFDRALSPVEIRAMAIK